jgi:hypothetical protein
MRRVAGQVVRIALMVGIVLALMSPRTATAEEPSKADKKKASKLVLEASRHKRTGDKLAKKKKTVKKAMASYARAATAYMESFSWVEDTGTVFKLAEVYDARGERTWAVRGYKHYLKIEPDGVDAMKAGERISELEPLIAADADAGKALPEDAHPELDPTAVFGLAEEPVVDEPPPPVEPPDEKPIVEKKIMPRKKPVRASSSNGKWMRWGGIGLAGVGVVFLGVGTKFGLDASSAASDLSGKTGQWNQNDRNKMSAGESASTNMVLFTVLGSGAIIAGGAVYYLGRRARKKARARDLAWTPIVGPDSFAVTVTGSF